MPHRVLSHTADTGIEATADSLSMLIRELAAGMFGLMARIDPAAAERWIDTRIESPTVEDLVVDTLSELLWLSEVEDLLLCDFRVTADEAPYLAIVEAGGVPVGTVQAVGPPIKAVTYHELFIDRAEDGWYGRVYFDV
ncbi:MAG: archease [Acidimicrobiia bacterium]